MTEREGKDGTKDKDGTKEHLQKNCVYYGYTQFKKYMNLHTPKHPALPFS